MKNNNSSDDLRRELEKLGAREYEQVALSMDPHRGLAALAYAREKGVEHPIGYAIKVFDNPDWNPTSERPRRSTNQAVDVMCTTCGGDRFIVHRTRQPEQSVWMRERGIKPSDEPIEEMKPCYTCHSGVDVSFWKADGIKFKVAS